MGDCWPGACGVSFNKPGLIAYEDYEDAIFKTISYLHDLKLAEKWTNLGKIQKKCNSTEFMEFVFSKSACDTWLGVNIVSKCHLPSSNGLGGMMF